MIEDRPCKVRILMKDGVPLVPIAQLPAPRFPREVSKEERRAEKMFGVNGNVVSKDLIDRDTAKVRAKVRGRRLHAIPRGQGLFTRYLASEDF